jgi:hypothetical protein
VGIIPWIILTIYLLGGPSIADIPNFVYAIAGTYLFFFCTFPANMILQYTQTGPWKDYRFGEKMYMVLSLLSKTLLGWLVFGGLFQPQGSTSAAI